MAINNGPSEGQREWETKEDGQGGEGAAIKAKAGKAETQRRREAKNAREKITNMKMLCMFRMIASITTKTIRNSAAEWSE